MGGAVCNHVFTQKSSIRAGGMKRAFELDLMPAASYQKRTEQQWARGCGAFL